MLRIRRTTCITIESGGSSAFGNELPKKGGAWLSGEAVQANTTGTPPDGPKSRKLHYGESVGRKYVSPPSPVLKASFQRAALEPFGVSFFDIFLHAKKDVATGGRRLPNAAGKHVKVKNLATGGRRFSREVSAQRSVLRGQ